MDFASIDWVALVEALFAVLGLLGVVGGGAYAAKRRYDQNRHVNAELEEAGISDAVAEEWKELAKVRGDAIEDMKTQIRELTNRVAQLEGAYAALELMKEQSIAEKVVDLLEERQLV
jgi:uncharacterized coiled-coil protein SlyX